MRYNKFHNKKIITPEGKFDSQFELDYWEELKARQERGEISDLQRQVDFEVIPRQSEMVEVRLKTKTKLVERFLEHPTYYRADFVYIENGQRVIVDTKGVRTSDYIMKRKLMRLQGNPITEIRLQKPKEYIKLRKVRKSYDLTGWAFLWGNGCNGKPANVVVKEYIKSSFTIAERKQREFIYIPLSKGGVKYVKLYGRNLEE